jgi:hypothetical protein
MNSNISKYTVAYGLSLAIVSVVNSLLVLLKEMSEGVHAWMARLTGHHWVTHSIFIVLLFVLLGWLFGRINEGRGIQLPVNRLIAAILGGVVLGGLIIAGFNLIETLEG